MKFKSPTDEPMQIGLTSGHTCVIPPATEEAPDGVEIEPRFHRLAIASGAIPAGVSAMPAEENLTPTRTSVITTALQAMLDGNDEADFKRDGTPDLNAVTHRVGFKVTREEVQAIWAKVKAGA